MIQLKTEILSFCEALNVSRESIEKLYLYVSILMKWQKHISLISSVNSEEIWTRHIFDSLQLLKFMDTKEERIEVLDLGSGQGLPGLIIAIARPDWNITLLESNQKKAAFLREAARQLSIKIIIENQRIEDFAMENRRRYHWITSRALAPLTKLLTISEPFLENSRGLFHKGQDVDHELEHATKYWNIDFLKHPSVINPNSVILEIIKATR